MMRVGAGAVNRQSVSVGWKGGEASNAVGYDLLDRRQCCENDAGNVLDMLRRNIEM